MKVYRVAVTVLISFLTASTAFARDGSLSAGIASREYAADRGTQAPWATQPASGQKMLNGMQASATDSAAALLVTSQGGGPRHGGAGTMHGGKGPMYGGKGPTHVGKAPMHGGMGSMHGHRGHYGRWHGFPYRGYRFHPYMGHRFQGHMGHYPYRGYPGGHYPYGGYGYRPFGGFGSYPYGGYGYSPYSGYGYYPYGNYYGYGNPGYFNPYFFPWQR